MEAQPPKAKRMKSAIDDSNQFYEGHLKFVRWSYTATNQFELSVRKGDEVEIIRKADNNFWKVRLDERKGLIPEKCFYSRITVNWSYSAENEDELSVCQGEVVGIIAKEANTAKKFMCYVRYNYKIKLYIMDTTALKVMKEDDSAGLIPQSCFYRRCEVFTDYQRTNQSELTVRKGDFVGLIEENSTGEFWHVFLNGNTGLVPVKCFEPLAQVHWDYDAKKPDDLSVKMGDMVSLVDFHRSTDHTKIRVRVRLNDRIGFIPKRCFELRYQVYKDHDAVNSNSELFVRKGDVVGVIEGSDEKIPEGFLKVRHGIQIGFIPKKCFEIPAKETNPSGRTSPSEENTANMKEKDAPHSSEPEIEKSHRICEKVLRSKLQIRIIAVIFNYLGLPRSGKTTFRRRVTGEIENILKARQQGEADQPSTGVMEDGGQIFIKPSRLEMGAIIRSKIWCALKSLGDEANMLNQFFQQVEVSEVSGAVPESDPLHADTRTVQNPVVAATTITEADDDNDDDDDCNDEMFSIIREAMATDHWEEVKYLLEDTILLSSNDTGGHAEFLDLQAALVQGPSINLLFSRLVDDLDSLFKICYVNEEGRSTDEEDSTLTVEEVLYQALASIACFSGAFSTKKNTQPVDDKKSESKAMFVGTHLDMVSEEELREKDKHLRKRIESTEFYKKGIIEYVSEDQLMLAVDNMHGDQTEIKSVQKILERVIKRSSIEVSIPPAWLVFSLYLRRKKFRTISLEECEKIAGKLGINSEELQDALWFLHHRIGVLLYYPEVAALKNTVICQMQVVFDSTSNLIRNTFTFDRVGHYASKEFREKGQFSLKDVEKAASDHTDSLMPLEKLVMLLQHLNVLTPIPLSTKDGCPVPEPTYFMPCVLESARASELQINSSSEDPAPLMLLYECGYVPLGVFPSLITSLISQHLEGWKLIQKGLFKNRVQFRVGENYDMLTLISRPRYFEILLSRNEDHRIPISASLCAHVRSVIQSTLKTVTSRMNYFFRMSYKFGFECPTHPGREHLCVLASEKAKFMECLENSEDVKAVRLELHHKLWFARDGEKDVNNIPFFSAHASESSTEVACSKLTEEDYQWIIDKLGPHAYKWRLIGEGLGFTYSELSYIEAKPLSLQGAPGSYLSDMISSWLKWSPEDEREGRNYATLHSLKKAVSKAGLGREAELL